jgi:proteasome lid subunit RPN8/RPN11
MKNLLEFNEHVSRCFPQEACGIVVDELFIPCENKSATPEESFDLALEHPAWAEDAVQYVVHSHTKLFSVQGVDPRAPSKADMECQVELDIPFAIVYCDGLTVSEPVFFGGTSFRPALEEREFVFNANDCLTLMTDYMQSNHGIVLPSCPRDWDWFNNGETLIDDLWAKWGFIEVSFEQARPSDVLLFRRGARFTNHIGVYLGGDDLLHHAFGQLSGVSSMSKDCKYLHKVIRHKALT